MSSARSARTDDGLWIPAGLEDNMSLDAVLPSQFSPGRYWTPEMRLMLAVLEDAIGTLNRANRLTDLVLRHQLCREECAWFSSEDVEWPYSFRNICDVLDINVDSFRKHLCQFGFQVTGYQRHGAHGSCGGRCASYKNRKLELSAQYRSRA